MVDDWHDKQPKIYFPKFPLCFLKFAWHDRARYSWSVCFLKPLLSRESTLVAGTVEFFMLVATGGTSVYKLGKELTDLQPPRSDSSAMYLFLHGKS